MTTTFDRIADTVLEISCALDRISCVVSENGATLERIAATVEGPPPSDADVKLAAVREYALALPEGVALIRQQVLAILDGGAA